MERKFNLDGWEIDTHNKYGYIIHQHTYLDMEFMVLDANCCVPSGRAECRELQNKIIEEDYRQARDELIELMCGKHGDINIEALENLLLRLGIRLRDRNGSIIDFYTVFEDIIYVLKSIEDE